MTLSLCPFVRPKPYFSFLQNEPMELWNPTKPHVIKPIKPKNVPIHRSFPIPRRACLLKHDENMFTQCWIEEAKNHKILICFAMNLHKHKFTSIIEYIFRCKVMCMFQCYQADQLLLTACYIFVTVWKYKAYLSKEPKKFLSIAASLVTRRACFSLKSPWILMELTFNNA